MQATVASFDPETRRGTVLADDGRQIDFSSAVFEASGLRLLRLGQRVRLDRDDQGKVVGLSLITM
jgi:cold shock CspA family protein